MDSKKLQNLPLHTNQNYLKSLDFFWALSFLSAYVIIKTGLYHPPLWSAFTLTKRLLKICQREERAAAELLYLLLSWCFERDICVWQIFCPSVFSSTWFFAQHFFACTIPKWLWSDNKRAFGYHGQKQRMYRRQPKQQLRGLFLISIASIGQFHVYFVKVQFFSSWAL